MSLVPSILKFHLLTFELVIKRTYENENSTKYIAFTVYEPITACIAAEFTLVSFKKTQS